MALFSEGTLAGVKAGGPLTLRSGETVNERPKVRVNDPEGGRYDVIIGSPEWVDGLKGQVGKAVRIKVVPRPGFRPGTVVLYSAEDAGDGGW